MACPYYVEYPLREERSVSNEAQLTYFKEEGVPETRDGIPLGETRTLDGNDLRPLEGTLPPQQQAHTEVLAKSSVRIFTTLVGGEKFDPYYTAGSGNILAIGEEEDGSTEIIIGTNEHVVPDSVEDNNERFHLHRIQWTPAHQAYFDPRSRFPECRKLNKTEETHLLKEQMADDSPGDNLSAPNNNASFR